MGTGDVSRRCWRNGREMEQHMWEMPEQMDIPSKLVGEAS